MAFQSTQLLLALLVITTSSLAHGLIINNTTITQTRIVGFVACSVSGNLVPGSSGLPGVRVNLTCNNGTTNLQQAVTNPIGTYNFVLNTTESLLFDPSTCFARITLPLVNCTVSPPTGILRGVPTLVDTLPTALGKVLVWLVPYVTVEV